MRFESGNDDASLVEKRSSGVLDEEVESPLVSVRMKVSSATQTEVLVGQERAEILGSGVNVVDADSGGSSAPANKEQPA